MTQLRRYAVAAGALCFGLGALGLACASGGETPIILGEPDESDGGNDSGGRADDSSQVVSAYSPTIHDDSGSGGSGDDGPAADDGPTGSGDDSGSGGPLGDSGSCNAPTCAACVSGSPCCTTTGTCGCTWALGCIAL
jgi:hypothetical protein